MNRYIADLHLGHLNVIRFDDRPFRSVEEMNKTIIKNWNDTVDSNDDIYILGDFCWGDAYAWQTSLEQLHGRKHLIQGNHDLKKYPQTVSRLLCEIVDYKEINDNGKRVIMSHYPMMSYNKSWKPNTYMLFGHVHNNTKEAWQVRELIQTIQQQAQSCNYQDGVNRGQLINVGCMMEYMNYAPQTLQHLIDNCLAHLPSSR